MKPYDCRFQADRDRLDAAVFAVLPIEGLGLTRGQVTEALGNGATVKMVGASLYRQTGRGVVRGGPANTPTYTRA